MRLAFLSAAVFPILIAVGCSQATGGSAPQGMASPSAAGAEASPSPITVTDDAGRQVTLAAPPRRIVSISASNTEILYALGLEDSVVGVDQYSDYPPTVEEKPRVGGYARPDLEKIVVLEPDLILGTGIHVKTTLPELERRGLATMIVDPRDLNSVLEKIRLIGSMTARDREAEALVGRLRARIEAVEARVRDATPVRVFYELSPQLHTAGPGSFVDDLIRRVGGTNIAAGAGKEWPQLDQEVIFLANPEVILLADHAAGESPERVAARPGWNQISAVRNGRVVALDPDVCNRAGPRLVDGLEMIARTLHPERMTQEGGRKPWSGR